MATPVERMSSERHCYLTSDGRLECALRKGGASQLAQGLRANKKGGFLICARQQRAGSGRSAAHLTVSSSQHCRDGNFTRKIPLWGASPRSEGSAKNVAIGSNVEQLNKPDRFSYPLTILQTYSHSRRLAQGAK